MVYTKGSEKMYLCRNLSVTITILLIQVTLIGCTNTSTECYGSDPSCTTHKLSCPSPLVIQITNTSYGYRSGCNNNGLAQCSNITCCNEELGDCFIPFSTKENEQVVGNCSELETCEVRRLRRYNTTDTVCNGRIVSAYSKIQYDCISNDSSKTTPYNSNYSRSNTIASTVTSKPTSSETTSFETTSQPSRTILSSFSSIFETTTPTGSAFTTSPTATGQDDVGGDTDDVGSIVGGIFGAIIIIVIIIVVVVFLFKRRKRALTSPSTVKKMTIKTVAPQDHVIDGPGTINNRKDISGYDEVELDITPRVSTTDNYDHVGDDKLNVKSPKEPDNYNHIRTHDHSIHEDNYNHIGNNLSPNSQHLEADYNHINGVRGTFNDEDDYNHIGDNDNKNMITDDNYHHIGTGNIKVEGDYDHIGSENSDHDNESQGSNNPDNSEAPYKLATC